MMLTNATVERQAADTGDFLDALMEHDGVPLTFVYDGREIAAGYHVTEVKAGRFAGLDCGANTEAWSETIVQLWDVPGIPGEPTRPMTVRKFLGIMRKFDRDLGLDRSAKLTFEVSDPESAIRLYSAGQLRRESGRVVVALERRPASCKPRDRWLEEDRVTEDCCSSTNSASPSSCCP